MASKTVTVIEDDLDGTQAAETVKFAVDGTQYEIDLSVINAAELRKAFEEYIRYARRVGGRSSAGNAKLSSGLIDNKAVRAWAQSNGIEVNPRGRISADVIEQYRRAGH